MLCVRGRYFLSAKSISVCDANAIGHCVEESPAAESVRCH